MNRTEAEKILMAEYHKTGKHDFVLNINPNDFHSFLTSLRHLKADGTISGYDILDDVNGRVMIMGFVA